MSAIADSSRRPLNLLSDGHINKLIRRRIEEFNETPLAPEVDLSFIARNSTKVLLQHHRPCAHSAPSAVKCNPDPYLFRFLADLGLGFDCASMAQMELVLGFGVEPSRIVFSHPYKALEKIQRVDPAMRLLLLIHADGRTVLNRPSNKFDAPPHATRSLLLKARVLGLKVARVSFHIGKNVCFDVTVLDVGRGFPGRQLRNDGGDSNNFSPWRLNHYNRMFEAEAYVPTLIPVDSKGRHGAVTRGQGKHSYSI
ncbi:hypothetical protein P885DRAFT_60985 [Corynascus similis CBS 632.67]